MPSQWVRQRSRRAAPPRHPYSGLAGCRWLFKSTLGPGRVHSGVQFQVCGSLASCAPAVQLGCVAGGGRLGLRERASLAGWPGPAEQLEPSNSGLSSSFVGALDEDQCGRSIVHLPKPSCAGPGRGIHAPTAGIWGNFGPRPNMHRPGTNMHRAQTCTGPKQTPDPT